MVKLLKMNDDDGPTEKPSSAAQIVASNDDLLIQIIQWLPLKSLVQFRLVSNYWNTLILDSKLCLSPNRPAVGLILEGVHLPHGTRNSYIIFLDKSTHRPFRKINRFKDPWSRHCEIIDSCNGLLLCVSNRAHNISPKYYVCNPTTKKYVAIPQIASDRSSESESICGMFLAFDPSKSPHYNVVCVMRSLRGMLHLFEVYSSETGSWRRGGELFKAYTHFDFEEGVFWNGAIHWINIESRPREYDYFDTGMVGKPREPVYFNLDCDQNPKVFPKPPLKDKCYERNDYSFGESCDHLHFVDAYRTVSEFIVYEMRRDYSEWFVKYKVNIPEMKTDIVPEASGRYTVVVRGKNDKDCFLVIRIWKRIVRYNFEQKTCELLCDLESTVKDGSVYWGRKCPFQYIESLSSV